MTNKRLRGMAGEDLACRYLEHQGLRLVERNFRCRMGELDLIMQDGDCLVFVEVRCRGASHYGSPAESVTRAKQRKLIRSATLYLQRQRHQPPCRFDVMAISGGGDNPDILWIKDAFQT